MTLANEKGRHNVDGGGASYSDEEIAAAQTTGLEISSITWFCASDTTFHQYFRWDGTCKLLCECWLSSATKFLADR